MAAAAVRSRRPSASRPKGVIAISFTTLQSARDRDRDLALRLSIQPTRSTAGKTLMSGQMYSQGQTVGRLNPSSFVRKPYYCNERVVRLQHFV